MQTIHTAEGLRAWRDGLQDSEKGGARRKAVGFVPTMGALHAGHMALIRRARAECRHVIVSIFVNPTQFNEAADCETYPQPLEQDRALCAAAGVDVLFMPSYREIYPDGYRFRMIETEASRVFEGEHRPGHFDGVLTVVARLFALAGPCNAYFGEKDWQQLRLVTDMAAAFFMPVTVIPCPTVREDDGLAMSSRNVRLAPADRARAPRFYAALRQSPTAADAVARLRGDGFEVEYVADSGGRRLAAVRLGGVRLIDNLSLDEISPSNGPCV